MTSMTAFTKIRPQGCASIETRRKAIELFEKGYGYKTVAAKIGVSVYTVRDWGRRFRRGTFAEDISSRLYRYEDDARERVLELDAKGLSVREISEKTGIPKSTCKGWINRAKAVCVDA